MKFFGTFLLMAVAVLLLAGSSKAGWKGWAKIEKKTRIKREIHLPGYQYCGPGTKLRARLQRGDVGINGLDKACKQHDIAYSYYHYNDFYNIHRADKILEYSAWERVKHPSTSLGEKINAWIVTHAMKLKRKMGLGR